MFCDIFFQLIWELKNIQTEIQEFVRLFCAINNIQRETEREDEIIWRWTLDGKYTTKSAYLIQLLGIHKQAKDQPNLESKNRA